MRALSKNAVAVVVVLAFFAGCGEDTGSRGPNPSPPGAGGKADSAVACVDNVQCLDTENWDPAQCRCVPDDVGLSCDPAGDGSDCSTGVCNPSPDDATVGTCADNVLAAPAPRFCALIGCLPGNHWDEPSCSCVADTQ